MSVAVGIINKSRKEKTMKNQICVYCMSVLDIDAISCYHCREYKGVMPLDLETLKYLGENPNHWTEYLD